MFRFSHPLKIAQRHVRTRFVTPTAALTISPRIVIAQQFPKDLPYRKARFSTTSEDKGADTADVNDASKPADVAEDAAAESKSTEDPTVALQEEIRDLKEKYMRSLAEEENVRRIAKKDVENAHAYANTSFAKAMLDVADDLERALAVVPPGGSEDSTLTSLVEGIQMTDKNLHKIFNKFGVVQYGKVGEAFDPNLHDALFQIPDKENPPDTIGQIVKTGYKLKDRVIRAAQVGTRVAPP